MAGVTDVAGEDIRLNHEGREGHEYSPRLESASPSSCAWWLLLSSSPMLILSLDTTTRAGSCALLRDERVLREQASDASRDQAERLPGDLAALLEREAVPLAAVDAFAVATGPGSFTGLRVGIATM